MLVCQIGIHSSFHEAFTLIRKPRDHADSVGRWLGGFQFLGRQSKLGLFVRGHEQTTNDELWTHQHKVDRSHAGDRKHCAAQHVVVNMRCLYTSREKVRRTLSPCVRARFWWSSTSNL